jgi:hypothetical protein
MWTFESTQLAKALRNEGRDAGEPSVSSVIFFRRSPCRPVVLRAIKEGETAQFKVFDRFTSKLPSRWAFAFEACAASSK